MHDQWLSAFDIKLNGLNVGLFNDDLFFLCHVNLCLFQYYKAPATAPTRLDRCSRIEFLPLAGSCIHTRSISIRHRLV